MARTNRGQSVSNIPRSIRMPAKEVWPLVTVLVFGKRKWLIRMIILIVGRLELLGEPKGRKENGGLAMRLIWG